MATGSNRFLQYLKQPTSTGTKALPSTAIFTRLRNTGGGGIANNRTSLTSNEIRSDRQIIETRLGQNQPDVTVPFELSYESYDDFIQGALGGSWVGGATVQAQAAVDTGGIFTIGAGEWADHDITEGEYVYIGGGALNPDIVGEVGPITTLTLTIYEVGTTTPITTSAEDVVFTFITGHYAATAEAITVTVAGDDTTISRDSAGTWADLYVETGDKIFLKGLAQADRWIEVKGFSGDDILVRTDVTPITGETATVDLVTSTGFITVGTELDFFAIEEGFTDIDSGYDLAGNQVNDGLYHNILGCYVANWNLNIQPDSILTGEFAFQGLVYSGFENDTAGTGPHIESNINNVFDSFTGNLRIVNAPEIQSVITGLNFTLDNGLTRRYALMDKNAISIGDGRSNVTGTLNAYFENATVANLFEQETDLEASIRSEDLSGNSYTFGWPKVKLTSESRDVSESDVTETLNFQALGGLASDKKKTMYVLRQPAIA